MKTDAIIIYTQLLNIITNLSLHAFANVITILSQSASTKCSFGACLSKENGTFEKRFNFSQFNNVQNRPQGYSGELTPISATYSYQTSLDITFVSMHNFYTF